MLIPGTQISIGSRDNVEPCLSAGHVVLRGEKEWLVRGPADDVRTVAKTLEGFAALPSDDLLLLNFGNAIGYFQVPPIGRIEVRTGKCGSEEFDRMILDITEIAAGLPFAGRFSGALPYNRTEIGQEKVLYHAFVYLRYSLSKDTPFEEQFLPALKVVLSEPHRRFARVRSERMPFAVSKVDARTLLNIATGRRRLLKVSGSFTDTPVVTALSGYLPERVDEPDVRVDYDTAENRFVKRVLNDAMWVVARMRELLLRQTPSTFVNRLLFQCDELQRALDPIARSRFWRQIGDMIHVPSGSTVLHQRRGYRQIYRHFVKSRLSSRVPLEAEEMADLLEAKDIAQLYEIWCYFVLVDQVRRVLGSPSRLKRPDSDELQLSLKWEFETEWPDGTRVLYNPRFSRSRSASRFAYSVPLRPDFAIEVPDGPNKGLHLLDAKFRVEGLTQALDEANKLDEPDELVREERVGTFKIADLYKMHTYRDAIEGSRSVWALYPGDRFTFFSTQEKVEDPVKLPERFDGVGAIPLRPGHEQKPELRSFLSCLFK